MFYDVIFTFLVLIDTRDIICYCSELGLSTHEDLCSILLCSYFMPPLTGANDDTNPRTVEIRPGSLLLKNHQPATSRVLVTLNQYYYELVFSGEQLLGALSDLKKFY